MQKGQLATNNAMQTSRQYKTTKTVSLQKLNTSSV